MSTPSLQTGACLCGSCKLVAHKADRHIGVCHCSMCRNWSGGPLLALDCGTEVKLEGKENINIFSSSEWAERGFCKNCGTHLFYRLKDNQQYIVPVGLFKNDHFMMDHQIFVEEKPEYYDFANKTKMMTGEEVFASFNQTE